MEGVVRTSMDEIHNVAGIAALRHAKAVHRANLVRKAIADRARSRSKWLFDHSIIQAA